MTMPRVTVGLPVYNGAATLAAALDCLLAQDFKQFAIFISGYGLTDATPEICRQYARAHPNITWHRHPQTLFVMDNYRFALREAKTEYFMRLASDDVIAPQFISRNCAFLDANPDYVSSQSKVLFHNHLIPARMSRGTFGLHGTLLQNLAAFLHKPQDNSRFYGLLRTTALQASYTPEYFLGLDWAIMMQTLQHGKQNEIDDVLMLRDATPPENYQA